MGPETSNAVLNLPDRIGRYQILGLLATGGMAEILLGRLVGPGGFERPVVVKRVLPHLAREEEFRAMFLDEARVVAQIRHPNVVQVIELGYDQNELYLVMEYVEGETLSSLLRRLSTLKDRLPYHLAAHVIAEACAGLHAAHELTDEHGTPLEIVHRDVSPQNVMISYDGVIKILDFGIAKAVGRETQTTSGVMKGKFAYMAPEQCRGEPVDRRSDIFALGVLLFESTTGRRLFARANEAATLRAVLLEPMAKPSDVFPDYPPALEAICLRALAPEPEQRYATAAEMRRDLAAAIHSLGPSMVAEDVLAELMPQLFAERIEQKQEMLRRVRSGSALTRIPALEVGTQDVPIRAAKPRRTARYVALFSGAILVSAALGVAAWFALPILDSGRDTPIVPRAHAPSDRRVVPMNEPVSTRVVIHIETLPAGATVSTAGIERGITPLDLELERASGPIELTFEHDGYVSHVESVTPDVEQRLRLTLQRERDRRPDMRPDRPASGSMMDDEDFYRFD
jgi:serine/threonine protein kinase